MIEYRAAIVNRNRCHRKHTYLVKIRPIIETIPKNPRFAHIYYTNGTTFSYAHKILIYGIFTTDIRA